MESKRKGRRELKKWEERYRRNKKISIERWKTKKPRNY
jgi:hypothetical protein